MNEAGAAGLRMGLGLGLGLYMYVQPDTQCVHIGSRGALHLCAGDTLCDAAEMATQRRLDPGVQSVTKLMQHHVVGIPVELLKTQATRVLVVDLLYSRLQHGPRLVCETEGKWSAWQAA